MQGPYIVREGDYNWIPMSNGVFFSYLRKCGGEFTVLLKMEASGRFPVHEHIGGEEFFVVEGDVRIGKEQLKQGDYYYAPPGVNQAAETDGGCILLISSARGLDKPVQEEAGVATSR